MRPFLRGFGSKWAIAKFYGRPRSELVIEPFAGSAGYSVYWDCRYVKLYDLNENVCAIWDFLINCTERDIERMPDWIDDPRQVISLPDVQKRIITQWLSFGTRNWIIREYSQLKTYKNFLQWKRDGGENPNASGKQLMWCPDVKRRIIKQKERITEWTIDHLSYEKIPNVEAHWHIDPPYSKYRWGLPYKFAQNKIDYNYLSQWCKTRDGAVDVCEQEGADWLEFKPLKVNTNLRRKKYTEMVWRNERMELF